MKPLKKLPGYTLTELIVAMLISSLVLGFALQLAGFIQIRFSSTAAGYANTVEFLRLKGDMSRCFFEADGVFMPDSSLQFVFQDRGDVLYHFRDSAIIREQEQQTDTFYIKTQLLTKQKIPDTELLHALSFRIPGTKSQLVAFQKYYPVSTYVNNYNQQSDQHGKE